jgi:multisubunit Na+/H+ antiporter MnhB subunit
MQVVLIILSVIVLVIIINYAVSGKSSRIVRLTALGALGLIALSLGVASIIIAVNTFSKDNEEDHLPIFLEAQQDEPKKTANLVEIIIFLVIIVALIAVIAVVSSMERKKRLAEAKKAGPSRLFTNAAKPADSDVKAEETPDKAKDDEFNLNM